MKSRAHAQTESAILMHEEITTHIVEALTRKVSHMREKRKELAEKFHSLDREVQGEHTT
jgi:hypothetical protein